MPLPYRYSEWSSSDPSPSGVAAIFARNSANSDTWNWLIFGHLGDLVGVVAVVRQRMVRIGHADLRIRAIARLAGELERDHPRDVALQRENLQVEHQPGVVGVRGRHADGAIEIRQRSCPAALRSASWMRRSTSRTASRYSATRARGRSGPACSAAA